MRQLPLPISPTAVKTTFHSYPQQRSSNLSKSTAMHFNTYSNIKTTPHIHGLFLHFEHDIQAATLGRNDLSLKLSNSFVCINSMHVCCFNYLFPNANQPCILQGMERKLG